LSDPASEKTEPGPGVTVVIPARDEEQGIAVTLEALRAVEPRLAMPLEILVVDDGSTDATPSIAEKAGARVLSHPRSGGYGRSLKTGIEHARYEIIATTDADGTYPIEELPALLEEAARFDMVVGARTGPHYRQVLLSPTHTAFLLLTNFVTGTWIPDPNSGLRVFRRSQVLPLLDRLPNGFSFTTTITLVLTLEGKFVHFHPIAYRARIGRSKVRYVRDAIRAAQGMLEVILRHNPLKAFLALALAPFLAACMIPLLPLTPTQTVLGVGLSLATAVVVLALGMVAFAASSTRRRQ
jgi:glycosyltransferase involved in cell wall biosynthesis